MEIKLLKRSEIVKEKWNGCVHYAPNGNLFAYTWFLDSIAKDWEALVEGDYVSVFPLVYRRDRFNRLELHQPPLIRALGIYSVKVLSALRIQSFLEAIPVHYTQINVRLNSRTKPRQQENLSIEELTNYQLLLSQPYESLEAAYTDEFKAAVERAEQNGLLPNSNLKPEKIADFFKQYGKKNRNNASYYHGLQRIMYNALHRGGGFATGVNHPDDQSLLAVNFYLYSHGKMISLVPVVSPRGAQLGALEFLKDLMIRTNAGRPLSLDFNTDQKDELAIAMGAKPQTFYQIRRNKKKFIFF